MPSKAPRVCPCGKVVPSGKMCPCAAARKAAKDKLRPNSNDRGYDSRWRALRLKFLKMHPACEHPGCVDPSTEVDHILSVREHPELRLEWKNLRAFCKPHHSARTARDQGFARPRQ